MNLIDRIKNFTAKKVVAPAMILGSLAAGYTGQAQIAEYKLNEITQLESFSVDQNNNGFEDLYSVTKNPYENQIEFNKIKNLGGMLSTAPPTQEKYWKIPAQKNRHFEIFELDQDNDGFKEVYVATINTNKKTESDEITFYMIENLGGMLSRSPPILIPEWSIPIQKNTTFSITITSDQKQTNPISQIKDSIQNLQKNNDLNYKTLLQIIQNIEKENNNIDENIYIFTKNPEKLTTQTYKISDLGGMLSTAPPTLIPEWEVSLGSPKN